MRVHLIPGKFSRFCDILWHFRASITCSTWTKILVESWANKVTKIHSKQSAECFGQCMLNTKNQTITKLQAQQKKWSGHGRTGRTADYGLEPDLDPGCLVSSSAVRWSPDSRPTAVHCKSFRVHGEPGALSCWKVHNIERMTGKRWSGKKTSCLHTRINKNQLGIVRYKIPTDTITDLKILLNV